MQAVETDGGVGRGHDKEPRAATQTGRVRQGSGSWIGSSSVAPAKKHMRQNAKGKRSRQERYVRQDCAHSLRAMPWTQKPPEKAETPDAHALDISTFFKRIQRLP
ncbi:hypothetical protein SCH4B_1862 [Ruegeria sp. TrichCH4B]|nr:hypothetical protein SCH4B_1862 [Ruegeria sp. TrichCH4B]